MFFGVTSNDMIFTLSSVNTSQSIQELLMMHALTLVHMH